MRFILLITALLSISGNARAADDKVAACLPVAKAGWEATVEVFDDVLSGKPEYEAVKKDPSEKLLELARAMPSAEDCAMMLGLYGPDGIKALMLESSREDLANGKRPRIFD